MLYLAIDHPALACRDVQKQADWYCRTLDMRVIASNGENPPSMVIGCDVSLTAGAMIELMPARDPGPAPAEAGRFSPGLRHLAFRVSDFDRAFARLREAGVELTTQPGNALGGGRTVLFRDPEGNELQIVQR